MPTYSIYVSDKKDPQLVEAFNQMRADGNLAQFIVESCQANLEYFLDGRIAAAKAKTDYFEGMKSNFKHTKKELITKKDTKKQEYLEIVPRNGNHQSLMQWLTSPASIRDWQAAGFKSAQEVSDALKKQEEK